MNGTFLIVVGLLWDRLELGQLWLRVTFWTLLYGTWANWAATLLAGIWGTGKVTPIASGGRTGRPAHERIVSAMLLGVGITDVIAESPGEAATALTAGPARMGGRAARGVSCKPSRVL